MSSKKSIVCVIPARLKSSRLNEKVLKIIAGKPMLEWVFEAATESAWFDHIIFAVDDHKTLKLVESFGATAVMTSLDCLTGTDRLIEVKNTYGIKADTWVNWQCDEPLIRKPLIDDLLQSTQDGSDVWTLKKKIEDQHAILEPHTVKVVTDHLGKALYFSRNPIPYDRDASGLDYYKHIGIYAYTSEALDRIATFKPCDLEKMESLEQLRFLYNGLNIRVHETTYDTYGVDLEEHLLIAEKRLLSMEKSLC